MQRTIVLVGLVVAGLVTYRAGVTACGDKSLGPGGIRWQRALGPASILIYGQPGSRIAAAARELKLQQTLQLHGHTYREVATAAEFEVALASGTFNVIMADVAETPALKQRVESLPSRPAVVGVGYKLTKAEAKEAEKNERFLVKAPSLQVRYLDTIAKAARTTGGTSPKT